MAPTARKFADASIARTYKRLRWMACASLIGLPLLTALAAFVVAGHPLEPSLSDYYFALQDGGLPRTLFVIFLAFLGGVLISYSGLDATDDRIHNVAGFFSVSVTLFPLACNPHVHVHCVPGILPVLHGPSAGLLFIAAIVSVLYGGGPKLVEALEKLKEAEAFKARRNRIRFSSAGLIAVGVAVFCVHLLNPTWLPEFSFTFWVEYVGFFGFGLYWYRLMSLIDDANKAGEQGQLKAVPAAAAGEDLAVRGVRTETPAWTQIP